MIDIITKWAGVVALVALILVQTLGGSSELVGGVTNYDDLELSGFLTAGTSGVFGTTLGVGTTTPITALGDVAVQSAATTTIYLGSTAAASGSCLQLENSAGTLTKAYINGTTWVVAAGSCK